MQALCTLELTVRKCNNTVYDIHAAAESHCTVTELSSLSPVLIVWTVYWLSPLLCRHVRNPPPPPPPPPDAPASRPRPAIGRVVVTWLLSPRISPAFPAEWRCNRVFPINKNQLFEGLNILMCTRFLGITSYAVENYILNVYTLKPESRRISARYTYELQTWALYLNPMYLMKEPMRISMCQWATLNYTPDNHNWIHTLCQNSMRNTASCEWTWITTLIDYTELLNDYTEIPCWIFRIEIQEFVCQRIIIY